MLSVQSMLNVLALRIYFVQNSVCVALLTGSEGDDLEVFLAPLQKTQSIGTNGHVSLFNSILHRDINLKIFGTASDFLTVQKSFVQIEYEHFFADVFRGQRKIDFVARESPLIWEVHVVAGLEDFVRNTNVFQRSLIYPYSPSHNLLDIVCFDLVGPQEPLLALDSVEQLFVALQINGALLQLLKDGIT